MKTTTIDVAELPRLSATQRKALGLPYLNLFRVGVQEARQQAQAALPTGWLAQVPCFSGEHVPSNAVRIGQVKVRTGDRAFPIVAVPSA